MFLTEKFEKKAYPFLLAELVLMAASIQIEIFFGGNPDIRRLFVITLCIMAAIFLIDHYKLYVATGVLFVVTGIVAVWQREEVLALLESNAMVKIIGLIVLAAVALYVSQHFFVMRLGVCLGYWGTMIFLIYKDLFPVKQVMFFLVAELVFVLAESYDRLCYRNKSQRNKKMFFLWPAVLLLVLVLSVLPYNKEPLKWARTKRFIHSISNQFDVLVNSLRNWGESVDEFWVGFTGYSESGGFFGNKISNDGKALELKMPGNSEHIYLVGNIKNVYTGRGWEGNPENSEGYGEYKEYQLDAVEYLYAMYRAGVISDNTNIWYIHYNELKVDYAGIGTSSLFRPAKTMVIDNMKHRGSFVDSADNISFNRNQNKKTTYDLQYFSINRSAEVAVNIIKEQSRYQYDTLSDEEYHKFRRAIRYEYPGLELPNVDNFEQILGQRAEYIREAYLDLPLCITERTYRLAEEITSGCETDYDKMVAIVEYLSDYEYTITPGGIPDDREAVDYFLFDAKRGYCTYFATAAAVLGRCMGIPTRYMQGYLLDINCMGNYGSYTVKEDQAHAWVECYFEGVGWLTFEATPGNAGYLYQDWNLPAYITGEGTGGQDVSGGGVSDEDDNEDEDEELEPFNPVEVIEQQKGDKGINPLIYVFAGVLIFIIAGLIYLKLCEVRFWRYYKKASYSRKVRLDILMMLWILQHAGYPMDNTETLREYFARMQSVYPDRETVLKNVCNVYMQLRYGGKKEATKDEHRMIQRLRLNFMDKKVNEGAMARQCLRQVLNNEKG